ncbi:MAG: ATP-binding protein [bacterium]
MTYILILLATFVSFLLGLYVFLNNPNKNRVNPIFFIFSITCSLWIISNYYSVTVTDTVWMLFWIKFVLFVTTFLGTAILFVSLSYPNVNNYLNRKKKIIYILVTLFVAFCSFLPTTVTDVHVDGSNISPVFGPTYALYILLLLFNAILCLYVLIKKYKSSKGLDRVRIQYLLMGFAFMIIFSITSNVLFVIILKTSAFVTYGPLSVIILDGFIAYSIIKHRFLSITNFANSLISVILNTLLLYGVLYVVYTVYIFIFGSPFTVAAYIVNFFIALIGSLLLNYIFRKTENAKYIRKKYDTEKYISILRNESYLNKSTEDILKYFSELSEDALGIKHIEIVEENNFGLPEYNNIVNVFSPDNNEKKLYLIQEDGYLFPDLDKENISGFICIYRENNLLYLLILGNRKDYSAYDTLDIEVLKEAAERINLAISRNLLTDEQKRFNEILQEKLDAATEELRKQKDEVEDRYRSEKDMVGIMGHELRTPLTTARGFLEIILAKANNSPAAPVGEFQHYLDNIYGAFKREIDLVQTMLSTSHVDNNKLRLDMVEVDLEGIIKGTLLDFGADADKKNLQLEYHPTPNVPHIKADPSRTIEVTNNLLSNAIKYTHEGKIDVMVTFDDEFVYYAVKDTGEGISEEEIPNIGKRFYRVQNYISDDKNIVRPGGTGLGMYIVKAILAASGGELRIQSKVGEGSTFTAVFQRWDK